MRSALMAWSLWLAVISNLLVVAALVAGWLSFRRAADRVNDVHERFLSIVCRYRAGEIEFEEANRQAEKLGYESVSDVQKFEAAALVRRWVALSIVKAQGPSLRPTFVLGAFGA